MKHVFSVALWLALLASAPVAYAQGVQTGTITGTVRSADGLSVPGVTVTAASPALQGQRTAVSDVNGVYFIKGLPAGIYTVSFEIQNFQPASQQNVELTVGGTAEVNTTLSLAGRTESITVTAQAPNPLATVTTSQSYSKREVDALPVGRTPQTIAELAPGLTNNTFNVGQVTISGGFGYDNIFMVNGVDVDDNLFGSPHNLYIEDAVQEQSVLVGGIAAEYGRFSGGVVNVITKTGGNNFSGSFRENFSKPSWIALTPRETANNVTHSDVLSKTHEGTVGGPIVQNRLWFFGAGRYQVSDTPGTFTQTGGAFTRSDTDKRGELKFTGTVAPNQTVQVNYLKDSLEQANFASINANIALDPSVLVNRQTPSHLFAANYNGVLWSKYFATFQYSEKKFGFRNAGGTSTAITDSPFLTGGFTGIPSGNHYSAPYFSALDPEDRNNRQVTGSLSYTASTKRTGTHDLKGGVEYYVSTRNGGNSQSATGYVFLTDYLVSADGKPIVDAKGTPIPVFTPGSAKTQLQNWLAVQGAQIDIKTTSLYVQDKWIATPRLTIDLGTRFEAVRASATGNITTVDTTTIVPRLGATFDLQGNSKTVLQATYGHYAGKYSERQVGRNTAVGNPAAIQYDYTGPAGQGKDFAPGFDLTNYTRVSAASFPTANIFNASNLKSPTVREFTVGVGRELGRKAFARVTYDWRRWYDFIEDYISLANGITTVTRPGLSLPLTNVVYRNANSPDSREYQGLVLQSSYRMRENLTIGGHYTLQIRNNGTFVGEAANQPGNSTVAFDYPEVIGPALDRYLPTGRLPDYQRHKLRVYGIYNQRLGRFGSVDISPLWRVNSGQVFTYSTPAVPLTAIELARNPGYPSADISPSKRFTLYYGDRGTGDFKGYGVMDLAATYGIPVWKTVRPWLKVEFYNLFNNAKQIAWDTTVTRNLTGPVDANGLPTTYNQGANFGKATSDNQFAQPIPGQNGGRLFRMAFGIRF